MAGMSRTGFAVLLVIALAPTAVIRPVESIAQRRAADGHRDRAKGRVGCERGAGQRHRRDRTNHCQCRDPRDHRGRRSSRPTPSSPSSRARKVSNARFRGIGSSPANPAITTYLDGVPQLNSNSSNIELLDVGQIEFVRGPQSPLFGRNTLGGIVNVTTARPSMSAWTGSVIAPFGNAGAVGRARQRLGPARRQGGDRFCRRQAAARRLHRELGHRQRPRFARRHVREGAVAVPAERQLGSAGDLRARAQSRRRLRARRPERDPHRAVPRRARLRRLHQPRHQQHHRQHPRHRPELRDREHHRLHQVEDRG